MKHVPTYPEFVNERIGFTKMDRIINHLVGVIRSIKKWEMIPDAHDDFYKRISLDGPRVPYHQLEMAFLPGVLKEYMDKGYESYDIDFDDIEKELKHLYTVVDGDGPEDLVVFRRRDKKPFTV